MTSTADPDLAAARDTEARLRSSLMGTAIGDAWGYPHEFTATACDTPMLTTGVLTKRMTISDDTQMTLALTAALRTLRNREEEPSHTDAAALIAAHFLAWSTDKDNDRAPGSATMQALRRLGKKNDTRQWVHTTTASAGCGAVMRLAPAALIGAGHDPLEWSLLQGIITHNSALSRAACGVLSEAHKIGRDPHADLISDTATAVSNEATMHVMMTQHISGLPPAESLHHDLHTLEYRSPNIDHLLSMSELLELARESYDDLTATTDSPRTVKALLMDAGAQIGATIGQAWDAGSAVATALLLVQLHRHYGDALTALDTVEIAAHWVGDRDSRAAIVGGLLGATEQPDWDAQFRARHGFAPRFERRYDKAIHTGDFAGFTGHP